MYLDSDINKKRDYYKNNLEKIYSNEIKNKFKIGSVEDCDYFSEISLFVDEKFKENKSINEKQLITESIFSTYQYLNKQYNNKIDLFLNDLNEHVNKIKTKSFASSPYTFASYNFKNIYIKPLKNNDSNEIKNFTTIFTHELCHSLSVEKNIVGLIKFSDFKEANLLTSAADKNYNKFLYFNEMQTQYIANEILKTNFPEFKKETLYTVNIKDINNTTMNFKNMSIPYPEISSYANEINLMYGKELIDIYFNKKKSLENLNNEKLVKYFADISENYINFVDKKTFENYMIMEQSFNNISLEYMKTNNLSNEEYFNLTKQFQTNSRELYNKNFAINFNDFSVSCLDLYKQNNFVNIYNMDKVYETIMDYYLTDDKKESEFYNFFENMNNFRNNDLKNTININVDEKNNSNELKKNEDFDLEL